MKPPSRLAERDIDGSVAGVDEVGRGPLCGPVVAAAVILPGAPTSRVPARFREIRDSKALAAAKRAELARVIHGECLVGIGEASVDEIDRHNILRATFLAMGRAIAALPSAPVHVLIDGNVVPHGLPCRGTAIVKGDATCLAIAAASIVAKEHRDAIMRDLARQHPQYGWARNAGYGTIEHRQAILAHGPTPHHRRSFAWGIEPTASQGELFA